MRAAVVGHVEWVRFAAVERLPEPGEIMTASATWEEPAGGGAVAAGQLRNLAGEVDFFVAVGNDDLGRRTREALEQLGFRVHAATRDQPQRRAFTFVDAAGERTITLMGEKLHPHGADRLPWDELARIDAVYFSAGDPDALRAARQARVLVATARELPTLLEAQVQLDALVLSARDSVRGLRAGAARPSAGLDRLDAGPGGRHIRRGRALRLLRRRARLPGPIVNAYGAGDSFAAGLAFALARGDETEKALAFAARCGAAAMTGRGAYEGQLSLAEDC